MSDQYFLTDPEGYKASFAKVAEAYASLMRMVENHCFTFQDIGGKHVYDVTGDLLYITNQHYKTTHNIKETDNYDSVSFVSKNELKTMLAEVVQEYFANATIKND
jgi:hypothetical protein